MGERLHAAGLRPAYAANVVVKHPGRRTVRAVLSKHPERPVFSPLHGGSVPRSRQTNGENCAAERKLATVGEIVGDARSAPA